MTAIQPTINSFQTRFQACFPEAHVIDGKVISDYNESDEKKLNENINTVLKEAFKKRFQDKQSGLIESQESIKSKRKWSTALNVLSKVTLGVIAVAAAIFFADLIFTLPIALVGLSFGVVIKSTLAYAILSKPIYDAIMLSGSFAGIISMISDSYSRKLAEEKNYENRRFCKLHSNEAIADFLGNGLTYQKFKTKYQNLFDHKILNNNDAMLLLSRDALIMSPYKFLDKHQVTVNFDPVIKQILDGKEK